MGSENRRSTITNSVTCTSADISQTQISSTLPYFLAAEADERIDSRVARYHVREGIRSPLQTYDRLFGSQPFPLGLWVPAKLDRLAEKLPGNPKKNLVRICRESTLLPLFQQFSGDRFGRMGDAEAELVPSVMPRWTNGESGVTHLCMSCLVDDNDEIGWPIIHRAHQVPGVTACWKHGTALMDRCPYCRCPFEPPHGFVLAPWCGCGSCHELLPEIGLPVQRQASDIEIRYAKFAKEILEVAPIYISSHQLLALYRQQSIKQGYGRKSTINRAALFDGIEAAFGKELFSKMDHGYRKGRTESWFYVMQSQNEEAPLHRHLMLSQFLFEDASIFIEKINLVHEGKLLRSSKEHRKGKKWAVPGTKSKAPNLLGELVAFARAKHLDIDGLWKAKFGDMSRLIKKQKNAIQEIEKRLSQSKISIKLSASPIKSASINKTMRPLNPADQEWAEKVANMAKDMYASPEKPMRISVNRLCNDVLPKKNMCPDAESCPRTYAALHEWQETVWHFYARRLVWRVRDLNGANPTECQLKRGLDYYRMSEVFGFMKDKLDIIRDSDEEICIVLKRFGIERCWEGPCPGALIQRTGRAHKKGAGAFKQQGGSEQAVA